jgi:hypothetical protein
VTVPIAPDPFEDLEALKSSPPRNLELEKVLTTVPVKRPGSAEWFQVHPDADYCVDAYVLSHGNGIERNTYWVAGVVQPEIPNELRLVRLFTYITKLGVVGLWPARIPTGDSNSGRAWHQSALDAADAAKRFWIRMQGNPNLGAYEYTKALGDLGEPQWPDKSHRDLIEIAFRDHVITTTEHPVIKDLRGIE